jgi:hypothetical protein
LEKDSKSTGWGDIKRRFGGTWRGKERLNPGYGDPYAEMDLASKTLSNPVPPDPAIVKSELFDQVEGMAAAIGGAASQRGPKIARKTVRLPNKKNEIQAWLKRKIIPPDTPPNLSFADVTDIGKKVSSQKQYRHILNRPEWASRQGGYFKTVDDAQAVLDACHSGNASVIGVNSRGNPVVRFNGVTGFNNNPDAGFLDQPTNIFMIKGTKSPSVVPISPEWRPR